MGEVVNIKKSLVRRINRKKCIELDGRCKRCGDINNLEPHHIIHVSQGGGDDLWNLITLCHKCHMEVQFGYWVDNVYYTEHRVIVALLKSYRTSKCYRWKEALEWWIGRKNEKR